jgi:hypothetical protein
VSFRVHREFLGEREGNNKVGLKEIGYKGVD